MSTDRNDTKSMALFCDFENVALGVRDANYTRFDISKVLERLLLKGSIVVKKAYCDWERYRDHKAAMHQAAFELIEIPHVRQSGKNSADIRMVVDALDLCYTKSHVDTFVIISGDSDFSPLVSKLRENAKTVIGVGVKNSTSDLLIANCDEFIYYDDLVRGQPPARGGRRRAGSPNPEAPAAEAAGARSRSGSRSRKPAALVAPVAVTAELVPEPQATPQPEVVEAPARKTVRRGRRKPEAVVAAGASATEAEQVELTQVEPVPEGPQVADEAGEERTQEAIDLVLRTIDALASERDDDDKIWGSMVKQTLKRQRPGFNEHYYGFRSFNGLLEEARDRGLIELARDEKSGGYTVRSLA